MKISTRGKYALRMMIECAKHPNEPTKLNHVAKSNLISEKYLEQIVSKLSRAGFVNSVRGAQGGYMLSRPACKYSVGDILRLTEGSLSPVSCLEADECWRNGFCVTKNLFKKIEDAILEVVDNISLEDLLNDELEIQGLLKQQKIKNSD